MTQKIYLKNKNLGKYFQIKKMNDSLSNKGKKIKNEINKYMDLDFNLNINNNPFIQASKNFSKQNICLFG